MMYVPDFAILLIRFVFYTTVFCYSPQLQYLPVKKNLRDIDNNCFCPARLLTRPSLALQQHGPGQNILYQQRYRISKILLILLNLIQIMTLAMGRA